MVANLRLCQTSTTETFTVGSRRRTTAARLDIDRIRFGIHPMGDKAGLSMISVVPFRPSVAVPRGA